MKNDLVCCAPKTYYLCAPTPEFQHMLVGFMVESETPTTCGLGFTVGLNHVPTLFYLHSYQVYADLALRSEG